MAVYTEIISWSTNKSAFVKDALRRLIISPSLSNTDIDDITDLLKKEIGFTGITKIPVSITASHIPTTAIQGNHVAKLLSIENPVNINALYNKAKIGFVNNGLNIVYGNNGSGKSSYAKILKRLCWSRHKNIELKTNVYTKDATPQSVKISYEFAANTYTCSWNISQPNNSHLNTVLVFDTACADIYLNNENPTEYKPIGIDILERLIKLFGIIENKINAEVALLTLPKPPLNPAKFSSTQIYNWYHSIESLNIVAVQSKLQFNPNDIKRKAELNALLNSTNPIQQKQFLQQKISRYQLVVSEINNILKLFSTESITAIANRKQDYINKYNAFFIAQQNISGNYPLNGVGSDSWRIMWDAAKEFAMQEVHPQIKSFPVGKSNEYCVFCQQELTTDAIERLNKFNQFINDTTSKAYNEAKQKLENTISIISNLVVNVTQTHNELETDIENFKDLFSNFIQEFNIAKKFLLLHLDSTHQNALSNVPTVTNIVSHIQTVIAEFEQLISDIDKSINNRSILEAELLELEGLEVLTTSLTQIIQYHSEFQMKGGLQKCVAQLSTTSISKKIGELLETEAILLQQTEFLNHLKTLNVDIASKVSISKTKTTSGTTFQRCSFNGINETISNILSEGEQKVVALANFLSECTIDNRTNTIVFDDPVTSLDQDYREAIANILVKLSLNRQVIILSHDLYFVRLIIDTHKKIVGNDCHLIGVENYKGISGIQSDEIPYLAKNVQERITSIRRDLVLVNSLQVTERKRIEEILEKLKKQFRKLLEKSIEEILANDSIKRFSKNITLKAGYLSGFVVTEHSDIEILLNLFGKYSTEEHDGGIELSTVEISHDVIKNDLKVYEDWKNGFNVKLKAFKTSKGYK